jgi:hypothetical protein
MIRSSPTGDAEKNPYASLPLNRLADHTVSTPPLVDFSRALPSDLFAQPARGFYQQPASESKSQISHWQQTKTSNSKNESETSWLEFCAFAHSNWYWICDASKIIPRSIIFTV